MQVKSLGRWAWAELHRLVHSSLESRVFQAAFGTHWWNAPAEPHISWVSLGLWDLSVGSSLLSEHLGFSSLFT